MSDVPLPALVDDVPVLRAEPLPGGGLQRHWRLDLADGRRLVLRQTASRVLDSLTRPAECAIQAAAVAAGVPAARPLACGPDWLLMEHRPGSADSTAAIDTADPQQLANDLADALARLHRCPWPAAGGDACIAAIATCRAALDRREQRHLVLEWGLRQLDRHRPAPMPPVLCHRDFRPGNFLVENGRLIALLDWEFAGPSDLHEDIGWLCTRTWRRHRPDRAAGGLVTRDAFAAAYETAGGSIVQPRRLAWWELMGNVRWAVISLLQVDRFFAGEDPAADRAMTGCRLAEVEAEILTLSEALGA